MRNCIAIVNEIEKTLQKNKLDVDFKRLKLELLGASTGGEYLGIATSGLLYMKSQSQLINNIIGSQIEELVLICKENGSEPKTRKF